MRFQFFIQNPERNPEKLKCMKEKSSGKGLYSIPEISIKDSKDWFIYFRFTHQGKDYNRKYREGINRIKDKVQRMADAEKLCRLYEDWLLQGWNPIIDPEFKVRHIKPLALKQELYFKEAMTFALSKKKLAKKSKLGYSSMLNFIKEVAEKNGYDLLPLSQFDRGICLSLIDECTKERNFSNHAYNKHVSVLRSMFSVLLDYRMMSANPLLGYKDREVPESNFYEDYTGDEKQRIAEHLLKVHPQLFIVMSIVYHTGIRPKEVLALKVGDISLEEFIITIAPEEGAENSKTKNVRRIPINPHLLVSLEGMKLDSYPENYFVFGSPFTNGRSQPRSENGKKVYGSMVKDYLTPNPVQVKRDTLTKLWKKLVIDGPPTGLGIKRYLYAAKHTGTDDKTDEGLALTDIQVMYGHSSEAMTARYKKRSRENDAKKEILAKSPAFIKSKNG
jgi:integrase